MSIADLFELRVEEKIEPVIKVGETDDENKLAAEIGSYVVTPMIEQEIDSFLEFYTDTFMNKTTDIGVWISGYFGSGKSHLAKIMSLLAGNRTLAGVSACDRFKARVPHDAPQHNSILRSLSRMNQCETNVLAFNINTLADSKVRPLPVMLLSQYYLSRGYCNNFIYACVIEAELDRQDKLQELHSAVEKRSGKKWEDIRHNPSFYSKPLFEAACEVAPNVFATPVDVQQALKSAESGEIHNVRFLVKTILDDLKKREAAQAKPQRLMLVLDESGQWIENDKQRLSQLQGLVEEAGRAGQGKLWVIVTTHADMGSIYKEARALDADFQTIAARFRCKPLLTTENIELVLEDRLLKKTVAGKTELSEVYSQRGGIIRGLGELANTSQVLPPCTEEKFVTYYPFLPCHIHLIPEIVKSLRSKGGRGEQMSGSTRTLLAITQDVMRAGRRPYLREGIGAIVSFDEIYHNLAGEAEVSADVRTDLSKIKDVVPGATPLTSRVAEVLYLIRELPYVPRTKDNIARLLVESVDDDLPTILARVQPELDRLISAKLVAQIGEEYEFLTGERRTFEDEVGTIEAQYRNQDKESGFAKYFVHDTQANAAHWREWLGSDVVSYLGRDFQFKLQVDGGQVLGKQGHITLKLASAMGALGDVRLDDLENQSLRADEQNSIFFLSGRVSGFDQDLTRYLAMKEVIDKWKGDAHRSEETRKLAQDKDSVDLPKLRSKVVDGLKEGLKTGHVVFRGASRSLPIKAGQTPGDALRAEMTTFWPAIYSKFDKVPDRITNDQRAIQDVLSGAGQSTADVKPLKLYDSSGKIDLHCPLLDSLRLNLATEQNAGRRILGQGLLDHFTAPPYGWDPNAVRVGVAALVRAAVAKILINKKPYTNPEDRDLVDAIRNSHSFNKLEIVLEETQVDPDVLTEVRTFIMQLARTRKIDETPSALSEAAGTLAEGILAKASTVTLWSAGSGMPLSKAFSDGQQGWEEVESLTNPVHRVNTVHTSQQVLKDGFEAINKHDEFREKSGKLFTELATLVAQLESIEHLVDEQSGVKGLISDYEAARTAANITDTDTWKSLQARKAQASLELTKLLQDWRIEANQKMQDAVDRLPADLAERGLDASLAEGLAQPLEDEMNRLASVTLPAQVAALPARADVLIRQLGERIAELVRQKETPPEGPKEEPKPTKPLKRLAARDVATVTRVTTQPEWESLRDKLDGQVTKLLSEGYEVELS